MSTNSTISIQHKDGSIDGVYCHWDGYPSWNGQILYAFYNTPEKVNELISHGGISSLGMNIGEKLPEDWDEAYKAKKNNFQCEFYTRDRGEEIEISHDKDIEQQEYNYLFEEGNEKWYLVDGNTKTPLSKVIRENYLENGSFFEPSDYLTEDSDMTIGDIATPEQLERFEVLRKTVMGELVEEIEEEPYVQTSDTPQKTILLPEIVAFLEKYGFNISDEHTSEEGVDIECQQYTPAGEDWYITVSLPKASTVEAFVDTVEELYENFNVDEEVALWMESAGRNGVPDARGLVEDNEWKDALLKKMSEDKSLDDLYEANIYTFSLADTLPSRSFTLDESSLETGTENGKSYVEYLVEVWSGDETGRDFYDDIYERAELKNEVNEVADEVFDTYKELKDNEGYEDSTMDVYVRVYEDRSAVISAVLKDNDGDEYTRDMLLDENEATAVYDTVENCLSADKLEELFAEARETTIENEDNYAKELQSFREENFYNNEDIIRTYMENAPLQEIIDFTEKPNVTISNYKQAVNDVIANTGVTVLRNYADKYIEVLYQNNIKGNKYLDNLDTPAMGDSRAETARNTKEITDD